MWRKRLAAGVLGSLLAAGAACLMIWSFGLFDSGVDYRPVPAGDQEIAFLAPATSAESWERLVAAVDALYIESQTGSFAPGKFQIDKTRAFVELTAEVPEVAFWLDGAEDQRIWIRWYKLTGESNSEKWINRLIPRSPPPLAIIGGDTSRQALKLATALQEHREQWQGTPPLLLLTAATIDHYIPHDLPNTYTTDRGMPQLIDKYEGRTFRYAFANARLASVMLDFMRTHDGLWPRAPVPAALVADLTAPRDPLARLAAAATFEYCYPSFLVDIKWEDDSFSVDLADRFLELFDKKFPLGQGGSPFPIEYSVGDFYQPNPREAFVVGQILPQLKMSHDHRQILLLPANAERVRRFLRTVVRRSTHHDMRNVVVVAGPSMSFNTLYRDHDVSWNIQDVPLPLVVFCHRNPVEESVGFHEPERGLTAPSATGTEDLLVYRDILESLILGAYDGPKLTDSADRLGRQLTELRWHDKRVASSEAPGPLLFQADHNRSPETGEHIVVLQPRVDEHGLVIEAVLRVYRADGDPGRRDAWVVVKTLTLHYEGLGPVPP
jgi:hypothetical protein